MTPISHSKVINIPGAGIVYERRYSARFNIFVATLLVNDGAKSLGSPEEYSYHTRMIAAEDATSASFQILSTGANIKIVSLKTLDEYLEIAEQVAANAVLLRVNMGELKNGSPK